MILVSIAWLSWFAASPVSAQEDPRKIRLNAQTKDGVVLVRVPASSVQYMMMLQRVGSTGFGSRVYVLEVKAGQGAGYVGRTLKPGRYRFSSITQQRHWSLGFGSKTTEFEVTAARVSYLGELNADQLLASLQEQTLAAGKGRLTGLGAVATGFGATNDVLEQFVGREPEDLADARSFSTTVMGAADQATVLAPLLRLSLDKVS